MKNYFVLHNGDSTRVACEYPKICPMCNRGITPDNKIDYHNRKTNKIYIFFYCPSCGECFVSSYKLLEEIEVYNHYDYHCLDFVESYPTRPIKKTFDKCIEDLSPMFCVIFNQAISAEVSNLNQISGIGYRKALEFLIKDYCKFRHPESEKAIESNMLSKVISDYIDSEKIKNLSKASAWIGNDETHYIRKFEDKDINDLKRFITATVAFITYDLTSDEAEEFVSEQ